MFKFSSSSIVCGISTLTSKRRSLLRRSSLLVGKLNFPDVEQSP
jgi:hypothetical protein